jgi:hypothetical protein
MFDRSSFPASSALQPPPSARVRTRAFSATSCDTRCLLHVAVAVMMMTGVFGVARAQGTWSTAQLSVARASLAAASVGNVALFAGGYKSTGSALLCREGGKGEVSMVTWLLEQLRVMCYCGSVFPVTACCSPQVLGHHPVPWMCTTLQQGHGRRRSSSWRAVNSQLHRLGAWLCSRGVKHQVNVGAGRGGDRHNGCIL